MPKKPTRKSLSARLDRTFSLIVRQRAACERCGGTQGLQAHHFYSRRIRRLRWDVRNGVCVDARCHWLAHERPADFVEWFKETRPDDYEYLRANSNEITHYSIADYQEMLATLSESLQLEAA